MNKDTVQGNWKLLKGKVKETWGDFTDNEVTELTGQKEQLVGKVQKKYGIAKEDAEKQVDLWAKKYAQKEKGNCGDC